MKNPGKGTSAVEKRLTVLHDELGSWRNVAARLDSGKLDKGMLCRIAKGKQRPPRSVVRAVRAEVRRRRPEPPAWVRIAAAWLGERERG
jgi:hypothetical protein